MNKNKISTPFSDVDTDTLSSLSNDTLLSDKPNINVDEPVTNEDKAEIDENNMLIFGKFKTLDEAYKGYKEAEKAITKSAELEKQIKQYQEEVKLFEQDKIAYENGFSNRFDMALSNDVWHHELDNYALAALHFLEPQQQLYIVDLIEKCRNFGTIEDITQIRQLFSPEIVALVSQDTALFKNNRKSDYEEMLSRDKNLRYSRKFNEFKSLHDAWFDTDLKTDLINQALEVSNGNVDLEILKDFVEKIEKNAVDKYLKITNAISENDLVQNSLVEPSDYNVPKSKKKKWLTKAEYYKLTPKEEAEKYDLIVEQVKLEKQGLLPRMLT